MGFGIAYSSQALTDFDDETLLELADNSAAKNEKSGISGYLYYRNGLFLQYLEGEQQNVENLMARIAIDPRHNVLSTVPLAIGSKRIFPHWYMRFLGSNLPHNNAPTLEDELIFILETTAKEHYSNDEVADAILHVTQRIARLDW
ncbi:MAG: BLUF domain-containing protein [Roseibacillus sp.]